MKTQIRKNLLSVLKMADSKVTNQGLNWYMEAHDYALELSETYQVSFNNVCGIISALSPSCRWERNKMEAKELIVALRYDLDYTQISFTTYGQNVAKAIRIFDLDSSEVEKEFTSKKNSGFKTYNFFKNIQNPMDENFVTIDRHAIFIYNGLKGKKELSLTRKQYQAIADDYIKFSKCIGVLPNQAQAILWETYQNRFNLN